tara:strand:- start:3947 stop:4162 length:216 start_codon:yes stop_codon:yes gene_type:complete
MRKSVSTADLQKIQRRLDLELPPWSEATAITGAGGSIDVKFRRKRIPDADREILVGLVDRIMYEEGFWENR